MDIKVFIFCVTAYFVQKISTNCIGPGRYANGMTEPYANTLGYGSGADMREMGTAYNGGGFQVTSYSALAPSGITVYSDNLVIEGPLSVSGQIPFLGVVTVEGPLPAVGQGSVAYGCGNGNVGIVSEGVDSVPSGYPNIGPNIGPNKGVPAGPAGYSPSVY